MGVYYQGGLRLDNGNVKGTGPLGRVRSPAG